MSIVINVDSTDVTDKIDWKSLTIQQKLTTQSDVCSFDILYDDNAKTFTPSIMDEIEITDNGNVIFGGVIIQVDQDNVGTDGLLYKVQATDYSYILNRQLVSTSYEDQTISEIIADILTNYTDGTFTSVNVNSNLNIEKIVFNQISVNKAIQRLADLIGYNWYVDYEKDIHFFSKFETNASFDITDDSGNYVYNSFKKLEDASQIVNRVKVRGGEYNGSTFTDKITINGNETKSLTLPYKFANLVVKLNDVEQEKGLDNIDDFTGTVDYLYNYNEKTIYWENALSDSDVVEFSGNPKVPVLAVAEDSDSVALYGEIEKLIRDNSIDDLSIARKRAEAELLSYADAVIDVSYKTYTTGLETGQVQNIYSTKRNINDDLIIKDIKIKMADPSNFVYFVKAISTRRYGFIELMQKILEEDGTKENENEVAEVIKVNNEDIVIGELIVSVSSENDTTEISVVESISDDPLGAGVEPTWVYGYYYPTGQTDTKRMAYFDQDCFYDDTGNEITSSPLNINFDNMVKLWCGDGSDGDVVISSNTTLTEDKYYNNLTINSGVVVNTTNKYIFVKGKLTNNGTIANNGSDGPDGEDGKGQGVASGGAGCRSNTDGGDGGSNSPGEYSLDAGDIDYSSYMVLSNGKDGNKGGDGGNSGSATDGGSAGDAGSYIGGTLFNNYWRTPWHFQRSYKLYSGGQYTIMDSDLFTVTASAYNSGGAGGGGGNSPATASGGGGGGAACKGNHGNRLVVINAYNFENNGTIQCNGGNGGNGGNGSKGEDGVADQHGGGGGGGGAAGNGGNGGLIYVIVLNEYTNNGTIEASGSSGGIGGAGGSGGVAQTAGFWNGDDGVDGENGKDGADGQVIIINNA